MITGRRALHPFEESDHPDVQRRQNQEEVRWWEDDERPFYLEDLEDITAIEAKGRLEGHPFVVTGDGVAVGRIGLTCLAEGNGGALGAYEALVKSADPFVNAEVSMSLQRNAFEATGR